MKENIKANWSYICVVIFGVLLLRCCLVKESNLTELTNTRIDVYMDSIQIEKKKYAALKDSMLYEIGIVKQKASQDSITHYELISVYKKMNYKQKVGQIEKKVGPVVQQNWMVCLDSNQIDSVNIAIYERSFYKGQLDYKSHIVRQQDTMLEIQASEIGHLYDGLDTLSNEIRNLRDKNEVLVGISSKYIKKHHRAKRLAKIGFSVAIINGVVVYFLAKSK